MTDVRVILFQKIRLARYLDRRAPDSLQAACPRPVEIAMVLWNLLCHLHRRLEAGPILRLAYKYQDSEDVSQYDLMGELLV